jgi:hypothetical protein
METAKFCGNCGSPFPRGAAPSTSLLNCPQGHVYSAVYEHCPYCPQPEAGATSADFATRIETAIETTIEPPASIPTTPPSSAQRTERVRRDYATLIEPAPGAAAQPTDPITGAPTMESFPAPTGPTEASVSVSVPLPGAQTPASPPPPRPDPEATVAAPPPPPSAPPVATPAAPPAKAPPDKAARARIERRTFVMPMEEVKQAAVSKGKLVGWVVTFTRNPDGEDYRLRAGRNVLGAHPSCDIVVEDEAVSGVHASIVYRNGRCFIKDELSSNGTFVNGAEIDEPRPLESYDEIRIGNTTLTFIGLERAA